MTGNVRATAMVGVAVVRYLTGRLDETDARARINEARVLCADHGTWSVYDSKARSLRCRSCGHRVRKDGLPVQSTFTAAGTYTLGGKTFFIKPGDQLLFVAPAAVTPYATRSMPPWKWPGELTARRRARRP